MEEYDTDSAAGLWMVASWQMTSHQGIHKATGHGVDYKVREWLSGQVCTPNNSLLQELVWGPLRNALIHNISSFHKVPLPQNCHTEKQNFPK